MKEIKIPTFLHEVLGEKQSLIEIVSTLLFALIGSLVILQLADFTLEQWTSVLAFILIVDVLAGCVANFTQGTNNFYAARAKNRLIFIVIHVHLLVIAWLLDASLINATIIWAYTIIGAFIVNALKGKRLQHFIAANLLCYGVLIAISLSMPSWLLIVSVFFMMKVLYSFAVDYYA